MEEITNPCAKEGGRSRCLQASAYLHHDLVHLAVSHSIRFEDGNSVAFTGWNCRGRAAAGAVTSADKSHTNDSFTDDVVVCRCLHILRRLIFPQTAIFNLT